MGTSRIEHKNNIGLMNIQAHHNSFSIGQLYNVNIRGRNKCKGSRNQGKLLCYYYAIKFRFQLKVRTEFRAQ